jgi:hypothetical protein
MDTATPETHDTALATSKSKFLPSVTMVHFNRKNDPLALGIEGDMQTRKSTHKKAGDAYLVDNSSCEESQANVNWDEDGFGALESKYQQAMFDSVEDVMQMRVDQIFQRWLSHFPHGNSSANL